MFTTSLSLPHCYFIGLSYFTFVAFHSHHMLSPAISSAFLLLPAFQLLRFVLSICVFFLLYFASFSLHHHVLIHHFVETAFARSFIAFLLKSFNFFWFSCGSQSSFTSQQANKLSELSYENTVIFYFFVLSLFDRAGLLCY